MMNHDIRKQFFPHFGVVLMVKFEMLKNVMHEKTF